MKVEKTSLDKVWVISPEVFEDHRGFYLETYNEEAYKKAGISIHFVQDDISISSRHVLRGLHGDRETWKLVSCLDGRFYLVVVNCEEGSLQFGRWLSFVLSDNNRKQVIVPPCFGVGHLVLSEKATFHYKQSTYYNPKIQFTYRWDDPRFRIWWPVKNPILSQRDEEGRYLT